MGAQQQEESECAFVKRRKGSAATDVSMELDFLDCPVCFHPLRPPIYQCAVGHVVSSSCRAKLLDKCHCCSRSTGYNRCHIIEHVVDSTKVPCCYNNFGCTEKITYYEKENHEKLCPLAPCFCPETGCSITGSTVAPEAFLCRSQMAFHQSFIQQGIPNPYRSGLNCPPG